MVNDVGLGSAFYQITFCGMCRDDMTDFRRDSTFLGQGQAGKRVTDILAVSPLDRVTVLVQLVFQQFSYVGQNCTGNYHVQVNRQVRGKPSIF